MNSEDIEDLALLTHSGINLRLLHITGFVIPMQALILKSKYIKLLYFHCCVTQSSGFI